MDHFRALCEQTSLSSGNLLGRRGATLSYWTRLGRPVEMVHLAAPKVLF